MFGLIWGVTARAYYSLRRFMPTNILLDGIHTRRGLKWGVPAMILAVPHGAATVLCAGLAERSRDTVRVERAEVFIAGPVTLMRLLRVRGRESRARRRTMPDVLGEAVGPVHVNERLLSSRHT